MAPYRPRKRLRSYRFRTVRRRRLQMAILLACAAVLTVSLIQLGRHAQDHFRSKRQAAELLALYEAGDEAPEVALTTIMPPETAAPGEPLAEATATFTPDPLGTLAPQPYPNNPYALISERFTKLRRQNSDIVGWLDMGGLLQQAVVQRDNTYYLRRDYQGYHNTNGAIFLDEKCGLRTRPSTLILYGHNMKTGAMFGSLRHYENLSYYHSHPFITFDTMYEEGRYVIFSVAVASLDVQSGQYAGFYRLSDCTIMEREAIIKSLCSLSKHTCAIDVNVEDQLLLLVTCVDDDADRRIVAARRVRDGESEEELFRRVQQSR